MAAAKAKKLIPEHLESARLRLKLAALPEIVVPAAKYISDLLRGVAAKEIALRIQLGLQEALANAVEHGVRGAAKSRRKVIEIEAKFEDGIFSCSISDSGPGFNWREQWSGLDRAKASTEPRGRGLFLIQSCFDQVRFNSKGNKISFKKAIKGLRRR